MYHHLRSGELYQSGFDGERLVIGGISGQRAGGNVFSQDIPKWSQPAIGCFSDNRNTEALAAELPDCNA